MAKNPYLKPANQPEEYTVEQVEELKKCYASPVYFVRNYVKIVHPVHGTVPFDLFDYQVNMLEAYHEEQYTIVLSARQTGKALDINTPIPTPTGWTNIGDIKKGDVVFGKDGKKTIVIDTTEIQYNRKCYNVEFSNGENIIADAEHLWEVNDIFRVSENGKRGKKLILTTEEMIKIGNGIRPDGKTCRYNIDITTGLNLPDADLPIDPYILGTWLGDGTSRNGEHTVHKNDLNIYSTHMKIYEDTQIIKIKSNPNVVRTRSKTLKEELKKLNLLENKHIPILYARSSKQQRIALLQGLMDTDGYIDKTRGGCEISQSNNTLAFNVYELLCSLGLKPTLKRKLKSGFWTNSIIFTPYKDDFDVFRLKRKLDRQLQLPHSTRLLSTKRRSILSITPVDSVPVKCITVNNKDNLFLAGRNMIPTHNCVVGNTEVDVVDRNKISKFKKLLIRLFDKTTYERIYT